MRMNPMMSYRNRVKRRTRLFGRTLTRGDIFNETPCCLAIMAMRTCKLMPKYRAIFSIRKGQWYSSRVEHYQSHSYQIEVLNMMILIECKDRTHFKASIVDNYGNFYIKC